MFRRQSIGSTASQRTDGELLSQPCCEESPRALEQRVPAEGHRAAVVLCRVSLCAKQLCGRSLSFAAPQTCRERQSDVAPTERGSLSRCSFPRSASSSRTTSTCSCCRVQQGIHPAPMWPSDALLAACVGSTFEEQSADSGKGFGRQRKHGFATHRRGGSLPAMLRGKSPCRGAESAGGRPQGLCLAAGREAFGRSCLVVGLGPLQHHRHAVSALLMRRQQNGAHSPDAASLS